MPTPSPRSCPWVVLDSNAFSWNDWYLGSAAGRLLRDEATAGRLKLVVPEVVIRECVANHERAVGAALDKIEAGQRTLRELHATSEEILSPTVSLTYRADLEAIVRDAAGEILPIVAVPHSYLVDKAVERARPFDAQGDGYRDALIWENVLELLAIGPDPVVLISNDHKAFAETKNAAKLATGLVSELHDRGYDGRVDLHFTLVDYTKTLPRSREVVGEWTRRLESNDALRRRLTEHLLVVAAHDAKAVLVPDLVSGTVRNVDFVAFTHPRHLSVLEAWVSAGDLILLDVALEVDYTLAFETTTALAEAPTIGTPSSLPWTRTQATSTANLMFEVQITDPVEPAGFAAHLVGWLDAQVIAAGS